jgi:hypothetical protein
MLMATSPVSPAPTTATRTISLLKRWRITGSASAVPPWQVLVTLRCAQSVRRQLPQSQPRPPAGCASPRAPPPSGPFRPSLKVRAANRRVSQNLSQTARHLLPMVRMAKVMDAVPAQRVSRRIPTCVPPFRQHAATAVSKFFNRALSLLVRYSEPWSHHHLPLSQSRASQRGCVQRPLRAVVLGSSRPSRPWFPRRQVARPRRQCYRRLLGLGARPSQIMPRPALSAAPMAQPCPPPQRLLLGLCAPAVGRMCWHR